MQDLVVSLKWLRNLFSEPSTGAEDACSAMSEVRISGEASSTSASAAASASTAAKGASCISNLTISISTMESILNMAEMGEEYAPTQDEVDRLVLQATYAVNDAKLILGNRLVVALNAVVEWTSAFPSHVLLDSNPFPMVRGPGGWSAPPLGVFEVRGQDYLLGGDKVTSEPPLFHLRYVQMFQSSVLHTNVTALPWNRASLLYANTEWLVLNFMIPGNSNVHIIAYFTASTEALAVLRSAPGSAKTGGPGAGTGTGTETGTGTSTPSTPVTPATPPVTPTTSASASASASASGGRGAGVGAGGKKSESLGWHRCLRAFWAGDKAYCDARFKLIPSFVEGSWAVKSAVGQKPALIGTKLKQAYYRRDNVMEVDIDISSSALATGILRLVRGMSKRVILDLGVVIQGEHVSELPERLLCQARYSRVDIDNCPFVYESS